MRCVCVCVLIVSKFGLFLFKFAGIYRTLYLACSIFVIDLGSVHGTFVANERLTKDNPVELEPGQSLRFAASTRTYILRKNIKALFPPPLKPAEINLPPPDPSNEEAVLAYNTALNRYGLAKLELSAKSSENLESSFDRNDDRQGSRPAKKTRKLGVTFRDQVGGELSEVIGVSDGAHVETEPGPVGVKEGSHVGKYESLVEITVIPKEKEQGSSREKSMTQKGVTDRLQEVLNKVKSTPKNNAIYDDLYGESFSGKVGSSWAYASVPPGKEQGSSREKSITQKGVTDRLQEVLNKVKSTPKSNAIYDDLYGESFSGKVGSSWAYASVPSGDGQGSSTKGGEFSHDSTGRSSTGHHDDDDDDNDLFGD